MGATRTVTTSAPFRDRNPSPRRHLRETFDKEFWDDFLAQIFAVETNSNDPVAAGNTIDKTVSVPMPIAGRVHCVGEFQFTATVTAAKQVIWQGLVDGAVTSAFATAPQIGATTGSWVIVVPVAFVFDVKAGNHTVGVRIKNNVGADAITVGTWRLQVRRGKAPPA